MAGLLDSVRIASSGLGAERIRLEAIATNMANARTTRTEEGGPFQRRAPLFRAQPMGSFGGELEAASAGVEVVEVALDARPPRRVYDPGHPDADADGYVAYPDINVLEEMVDLMTTSHSYEANANVVDTTREMAMTALSIGR